MTDHPVPKSGQRRVWSRYYSTFIDVPAGPDWRDRLRAAIGAVGGIALTGLLCAIMLGSGLSHPLLVAPMGATAVLLFAVPASPLAQPWSIIGGNVCSALVGIVVVHLVPSPTLGAALAVGGAIVAMSLLRCLHPPGGAIALAGVLGGAGGASAHYGFAFVPVGLNSLLLVAVGLVFHRFSGHRYPHRAPVAAGSHTTQDIPPLDRAGLSADDVDDAVAAYGETLDVDPEDLRHLFKDAELIASARRYGPLTAGDIMSRDIISIEGGAGVADAAAMLDDRRLLSLPVLDAEGRVEGVISPLDLRRDGAFAREIASDPVVVEAETPLAALLRPLSEGRHHAVLVVDGEGRLQGMVTQTDLIAALAAAV